MAPGAAGPPNWAARVGSNDASPRAAIIIRRRRDEGHHDRDMAWAAPWKTRLTAQLRELMVPGAPRGRKGLGRRIAAVAPMLRRPRPPRNPRSSRSTPACAGISAIERPAVHHFPPGAGDQGLEGV